MTLGLWDAVNQREKKLAARFEEFQMQPLAWADDSGFGALAFPGIFPDYHLRPARSAIVIDNIRKQYSVLSISRFFFRVDVPDDVIW